MTIFVSQKDYSISFYQGDSGNFTFTNIPTDKNYLVYFSIRNPETWELIGEEVMVQSNYRSEVPFSLSATYTDNIPINEDESKTVYAYGLKICHGDDESTLIPYVDESSSVPKFAKAPKLIVYPKYVEGVY